MPIFRQVLTAAPCRVPFSLRGNVALQTKVAGSHRELPAADEPTPFDDHKRKKKEEEHKREQRDILTDIANRSTGQFNKDRNGKTT